MTCDRLLGAGFADSGPTKPDMVLMAGRGGVCVHASSKDLICILLPKIQILGKGEPGQNKHPNQKISLCRTRTEASNFMFL